METATYLTTTGFVTTTRVTHAVIELSMHMITS